MIYRNCGSGCPGSTGVLLDLPVRTDTSNVVRYLGVSGVLGGVPGPYVPISCDVCGLPLKECRCIAGMDY